MRHPSRSLLVVLTLMAAACGGDTTATTSGTTTVGTTVPATTVPATTTTTPAPALFTPDDLPVAVLQAGDPWVNPILGVAPQTLTLDDIWPAEPFPAQRAVYEDAGFLTASFGMALDASGSVITAAHLFADAAGAATALPLIESSFSDVDLVAAITGMPPGALESVTALEPPGLGDRGVGVLVTGPTSQVVGYVWVTGNLLQFVRVGMARGNDAGSAAALEVARAMARRTVPSG